MRLAIIDDQETVCTTIAAVLESHGHQPTCFFSGEEFVETAAREQFDGLLVDFRLPGMNGAQTIRKIRNDGLALPAILISGDHSEEMQREIETLPDVSVLQKPCQMQEMLQEIEKFVQSDNGHIS